MEEVTGENREKERKGGQTGERAGGRWWEGGAGGYSLGRGWVCVQNRIGEVQLTAEITVVCGWRGREERKDVREGSWKGGREKGAGQGTWGGGLEREGRSR